MNIKLTLLLLSFLPSLCFATIYQWQDDTGQTHFGQEPPANANAKEMHPKVTQGSASNQQAPITQSEKTVPSPTEATAQKEAVDEKNKEAMKTNCERAKTFLQELESKPRIRLQDPATGNVTALTQEQRAEQIAKTKEAVKLYCIESK